VGPDQKRCSKPTTSLVRAPPADPPNETIAEGQVSIDAHALVSADDSSRQRRGRARQAREMPHRGDLFRGPRRARARPDRGRPGHHDPGLFGPLPQ
jgi:hypothetical protein